MNLGKFHGTTPFCQVRACNLCVTSYEMHTFLLNFWVKVLVNIYVTKMGKFLIKLFFLKNFEQRCKDIRTL